MPEPTGNKLIAALPQAEYQRLQPHLELVSLDAGAMISAGSGFGRQLYFPVDCAVNMLHADEDDLNEVAIIGNDGVAGIALILLGEPSLNRFMVINTGHAYKLQFEVLASNFSLSNPLQQLLFNYSQVLITQMGQNAYCRHHHTPTQQLGRLLDCLDHMPQPQWKTTSALLAEILGMPLATLMSVAQGLQGCGVEIDENRYDVIDYQALLSCACECHTAMQLKISHWLPHKTALDD